MINFNAMRHRLPVLKRLIPSAKKAYCRIFWKNGTGTVRSNGALFRLNYNNFVDRQIAFYGDYEDRQLAFLTSEMQRIKADIFFDIGANIGFYTVILVKSGVINKVVAFEPDARNVECLKTNASLNGLSDQIEVHQLAVSSQSGNVNFQPGPKNSTGQSKITDDAVDTIDIPATTLDDFLTLAGRNIGVKIDVEGHELDVLKGMRRALQDNNCLLQIEVYRDNIPLVEDYLAVLGYTLKQQLDHDYFYGR